MGDTGAYYVGNRSARFVAYHQPEKDRRGRGRRLGRHAVSALIVAAFTFLPHIRLIHAVILGVLAVVAQMTARIAETVGQRGKIP